MIFGDIKLSRADYSHIFIVCLLVLIGLATIYSEKVVQEKYLNLFPK